MYPLEFHREALDVAQHVIDPPADEEDVIGDDRFARFGRNSATYNDEQQADDDASAPDRFAAFAGRRT